VHVSGVVDTCGRHQLNDTLRITLQKALLKRGKIWCAVSEGHASTLNQTKQNFIKILFRFDSAAEG